MNQPTAHSQQLTVCREIAPASFADKHREPSRARRCSPLTPLALCSLLLALCSGAGCVSQNAAAKFKEFEALGITEATITGKFSNTDYKVEHKDGTRRATLDHTNAWLPKVHLVSETKEAKP